MLSAFDTPAIDKRQPKLSDGGSRTRICMHNRVIHAEYVFTDPVICLEDDRDWTLPGK